MQPSISSSSPSFLESISKSLKSELLESESELSSVNRVGMSSESLCELCNVSDNANPVFLHSGPSKSAQSTLPSESDPESESNDAGEDSEPDKNPELDEDSDSSLLD